MAAACLVQSRIDSLVHYSLSDSTKKWCFSSSLFLWSLSTAVANRYLSTCFHSPIKLFFFLLRQYWNYLCIEVYVNTFFFCSDISLLFSLDLIWKEIKKVNESVNQGLSDERVPPSSILWNSIVWLSNGSTELSVCFGLILLTTTNERKTLWYTHLEIAMRLR